MNETHSSRFAARQFGSSACGFRQNRTQLYIVARLATTVLWRGRAAICPAPFAFLPPSAAFLLLPKFAQPDRLASSNAPAGSAADPVAASSSPAVPYSLK